MARAPVPGRCKTRLGSAIGAEVAARLYEAMLLDTLDGLSRIAARHVLLAAPEDEGVARLRALAPSSWEVLEQRGADLGARLAGAVRDLWQEGQLVCLLDSDSPTLPFSVLAERLNESRCRAPRTAVVGPCVDGGYYLIGMTSPEVGVFEHVPWSTDRVMAVTRQRCSELGLSVEELPAWFDVDGASDLERLSIDLARDPSSAPRTAQVLAGLVPSELAR